MKNMSDRGSFAASAPPICCNHYADCYLYQPTVCALRFRHPKLASGDVNKVAEVVRDLWRREQDRGLSAGEKRMLAKARQVLVGELALAEQSDPERAEAVLDEALATAVTA